MLGEVLPQEGFAFFLIFVRLGTMIMVAPALGEGSIPPRVRLTVALALTFVMFLVVRDAVPPIPGQPLMLLLMVFNEFLIGILIGGAARLMISALHVAGSTIALQSGLAAAQQFDPSQQVQSALYASFLTLIGITLIFVTDLHHLLILALHDSYQIFPVGAARDFSSFAEIATETVASSFTLGIQLAAPFIVYGLVFYIGIGLVSRLMPQLPVFFVALPINVMLGFVILLFVISATMTWFLAYFEGQLSLFLQ